MRLNGFTEYGLLILAHMSRHPGERVTARQIAAALNIPRNHLTKVVHALGKAGYLSTSRGRTGGLRLGRPAELITVGDVIRTMQPDFRLTGRKQAEHGMEHPDSPACEVQAALQSALHAYFDVLDECTFADLASRHRPVTQLHMDSPGALLIPSLRESPAATTV
jgi:Rrf2 family nitric oxide-sensitive transcriptional repressor